MNNDTRVALWEPNAVTVLPDTTHDVAIMAQAARQLRERERGQVVANFEAGHFDVVSTFIWHRTMTLLKKQLATLGNEFIAELLQRPDIDNSTQITSVVSDSEAITLAKELGMLTTTQALRLSHSQEIVNHFASVDGDDELAPEETLTKEEAVSCLRVCVQGILGQERVEVAENFSEFRRKLESVTFTAQSPEIVRLQQSPYFFVRTAISILISAIRAGKGAELEHASRNAILIVRMFWDSLKKPERWQIGQAYAMEFSEGRKDAVKALHAVLLSVKGFDYVPESLRSNTFTRAAAAVISAHQGADNFYNESAPMRELANLGTSIPGPALAQCISAALCVKLGNQYGVCWAAQEAANTVLNALSLERLAYYFDERLENDELILNKLMQGGKTLQNWIGWVSGLDIDPKALTSKEIKPLIAETKAKNGGAVARIAGKLIMVAA
jgi:hypothetical protein